MSLTDSAPASWEFDVALSFSGEHRSFVRTLNNQLTKLGVAVFFDEEYQAELWGENLYDYLQNVYRTKARFVVAFASEAYGTKAWPTLERQSAQSRALQEVDAFLLPVRLDDSELRGILPTIAYVDARVVGLQGLVDLILKKLGKDSARRPEDPIPLTQHELDALMRDRPPGWEYFLFAGVIAQGKGSMEDRWRDHDIRLKLSNARRLTTNQEAIEYVRSAIDQLKTIVSNLDRVLSVEVQEKAFGPPGTPGDWETDSYMASRFVSLYEQLLSWAADVRSASTPAAWTLCFDILSRYCNQPIEAVREAVDAFVEFARRVPAHLGDPGAAPMNFELPIKFELDPGLSAALSAELQNLAS